MEKKFMEKIIARLIRYPRLKYLLILFAISQISQIAIDMLIFYMDPMAYAEYPSYEVEWFFRID